MYHFGNSVCSAGIPSLRNDLIMTTILNICILLEMLLVNLNTVHYCIKPKYSMIKTVLALSTFSLVLFLIAYYFLPNFGNGAYTVGGLLYIFPLYWLYDVKLRQLLSIMCSSWIYTMFAFAFSIQLGHALKQFPYIVTVFCVQTLFYICTLKFFRSFVKNKLIFLLSNIPKQEGKYLQLLSIAWFGTFYIIHTSFIHRDNYLLSAISLAILVFDAFFSYSLLHMVVKSFGDIDKLERIIYVDGLTGLKNRESLRTDMEKLIEQKHPFFVVFMDLDCFKSVNDHFGHLVGDEYLIHFSKSIQKILRHNGTLYRIAGDEFVCLFTGAKIEHFLEQVRKQKWEESENGLVFHGVSAGYSAFPNDCQDVEKLLALADRRMYEDKKAKDSFR